VRQARANADVVVVSIFVNPLQFGRGEDFERYPRTLEQDVLSLTLLGVDCVFAPDVDELYPHRRHLADEQPVTTAIVPPSWLTSELCGAQRTGHFTGVATVVAKLFHIVQPDVAIFGQKDYQQVAVIRQMMADLNWSIEIQTAPTVRDTDGLALSSRNQYLTPEQRQLAPRIYQMLLSIADRLRNGDRRYAQLIKKARDTLLSMGIKDMEYVEIRHPDTLNHPLPTDQRWVVLVAVKLGQTRLIDNLVVEAESFT
jgi:pantoate--beta-alanine ligase